MKDEVLARLDMKAFYEKHIPSLKVNGKKEAKGLCPFHEDHSPSLSVDIDKGLFNCFGCGKGGNAITFLAGLRGVDNTTSRRMIIEEEGLAVSEKPKPQKKPTQKKEPNYLSLPQIETIHTQLLRCELKLKEFRVKYGLNLDTVKQYRIGYQDGHYVIPREKKPGQWTFKNHKGYQLFGSKVGLYPEDVKKDQPVVITEAEFKALLLRQLGFNAVSGTGGAGTWKKEWNTMLYGLDIVIAYDNDEAGMKGTEIVIESLKGYARTIAVIEWPSFMGEKEDITDYFIRHRKTKKDFRSLIQNAREVGYELKEIDGIKFIEPGGFTVSHDHITYIDYFRHKSVPITILHSPMWATGRAIDADTDSEETELTFKRDGKLRKIWAPRKIISDSRKIIELADCGLGVNSCNSKKVIEYISAYEACNIPRIPRTIIASGLGWKTIKGKKIFLLGPCKKSDGSKDIVEFRAEPGFERFLKALEPQGSFEGWLKAITPILEYPYATFGLFASFTAPILGIIGASNFIADFWGHTSLGKTTLLEIASSVWGNPHKESGGLVFSWDSTRVYLEKIAGFFCDLPIFPDDSQTVDDRTLTNILYQVTNGVGRGRGSVMGIRHTPTWHTVCFSTGERPLTECTTFAGARARTIEIYGSPFPNAGGKFISTLKEGIRENYGHAGRQYIEGISSLIADRGKVSDLRKKYSEYQRKLSEEANSEVGDRYSQYFAAVKIAADLACRFLDICDPVEADESVYKVFQNIIGEELGNIDISSRAMELVISWVGSNENSFFKSDDSQSKPGESYGVWREREFIGIYPHKLQEVLGSRGFSERIALKGWAEKGWIKRNGKNLTVPQRVGYRGSSDSIRRLVTIPWSVIEEFSKK